MKENILKIKREMTFLFVLRDFTKFLVWPHDFPHKKRYRYSCLFSSNPGVLLNHFPALYSQSSKYFIYLTFKRLFIAAHLLCHFSAAAVRRVQGSRQSRESWMSERVWVQQRVEDCIFPKKTGAAIWVEVMDFSMHADRIGGSVGWERPLKTKWTKSSWFECSSAYTLWNVL